MPTRGGHRHWREAADGNWVTPPPAHYLLPPSLSLCAPQLFNIKGGIVGLVGFGGLTGVLIRTQAVGKYA